MSLGSARKTVSGVPDIHGSSGVNPSTFDEPADLEGTCAWITLVFGLISCALLVGSVVIIAMLIAQQLPRPQRCYWVLTVVALSGAVGGTVSMVRRLKSIPANCSKAAIKRSQNQLWIAGIVSLINGAIFAIVLFLIFLGGLVSGAMFPDFSQVNSGIPESPQSLARLLVFAFLAGFAERFVPDTLDRLVANGAKSDDPVD